MSLRLSIIIPCYNMGRYLTNCLQSITQDNLTDYEVICVDDGSTDNTIEQFNLFKYDNDGNDRFPTIWLIQQENQGVSVARNTGIEEAKGDYIAFVDPDDTVFHGGFVSMLELAAQKDDPDWVVGGYRKVSEVKSYEDFIPEEISFIGKNTPRDVFEKVSVSFTSSPWAKLYKRSFLNEYHIRFRPGMVNSQDTEFNSRLLRKISSFVCVPALIYIYRQNEAGATANFRGEKVIEAKVNLIKTRTETIDSIFQDQLKRQKYHAENRNAASFVWLSTIYLLYRSQTPEKRLWLRRIISEASNINPRWLDPFRSGNPRIVRLSMLVGPCCTHLLLSAVASIPFLRKRLRG